MYTIEPFISLIKFIAFIDRTSPPLMYTRHLSDGSIEPEVRAILESSASNKKGIGC